MKAFMSKPKFQSLNLFSSESLLLKVLKSRWRRSVAKNHKEKHPGNDAVLKSPKSDHIFVERNFPSMLKLFFSLNCNCAAKWRRPKVKLSNEISCNGNRPRANDAPLKSRCQIYDPGECLRERIMLLVLESAKKFFRLSFKKKDCPFS